MAQVIVEHHFCIVDAITRANKQKINFFLKFKQMSCLHWVIRFHFKAKVYCEKM